MKVGIKENSSASINYSLASTIMMAASLAKLPLSIALF
jgi:hypothetical protein